VIKIIAALLLISTSCFSQEKVVNPFQLNIKYSTLVSSIKIRLTKDKIDILNFRNKDSVVFSQNIKYSDTLQMISEMDVSKLNDYYSNACIDDGISLAIYYTRNKLSKTIILDNYYQNDIGEVVEYVNSLIPRKYKIWYDKNALISEYEKCNIKSQ
jgi:hypothetical protein